MLVALSGVNRVPTRGGGRGKEGEFSRSALDRPPVSPFSLSPPVSPFSLSPSLSPFSLSLSPSLTLEAHPVALDGLDQVFVHVLHGQPVLGAVDVGEPLPHDGHAQLLQGSFHALGDFGA